MRLSRDIAAEESSRANTLRAIVLYSDDPTSGDRAPGQLRPYMRHEPTRAGRPSRAALLDARACAKRYGECYVVEQRYDARGRHIVETVLRVVKGR